MKIIDGTFPKKILMRGIGEHFRQYAHALRFAIGLDGWLVGLKTVHTDLIGLNKMLLSIPYS